MKIPMTWLALLTLTACSSRAPVPQAPSAPDKTSQAAPVTTPWDGMKQDEQRARDVQKMVDKQAARQNQQIEQQTQ
jgi:hypothetical protein